MIQTVFIHVSGNASYLMKITMNRVISQCCFVCVGRNIGKNNIRTVGLRKRRVIVSVILSVSLRYPRPISKNIDEFYHCHWAFGLITF